MIIKELKDYLKALPDDGRVCYEDMNFGGAATDFDFYDIKYIKDDKVVLIASQLWEPCD